MRLPAKLRDQFVRSPLHPLTSIIVKVLKSIGLLSLGIGFSIVFTFSGSALLGAGHGSAFFVYIIAGPVIPGYEFPFDSIGWLIWPIVGSLIPWRGSKGVRLLILILLLTNYIGVISTLNRENINMVFVTLERAFPVAFPHLGIYLLVQYFIFSFVFGRRRIRVKTSEIMSKEAV
jgi:hypothetical protein